MQVLAFVKNISCLNCVECVFKLFGQFCLICNWISQAYTLLWVWHVLLFKYCCRGCLSSWDVIQCLCFHSSDFCPVWAGIFFLWTSWSVAWKVIWCCCQKKQSFLLVPAHSFLIPPRPCANTVRKQSQNELDWGSDLAKMVVLHMHHSMQFSTGCCPYLFDGSVHVWAVTRGWRLLLIAAVAANLI